MPFDRKNERVPSDVKVVTLDDRVVTELADGGGDGITSRACTSSIEEVVTDPSVWVDFKVPVSNQPAANG